MSGQNRPLGEGCLWEALEAMGFWLPSALSGLADVGGRRWFDWARPSRPRHHLLGPSERSAYRTLGRAGYAVPLCPCRIPVQRLVAFSPRELRQVAPPSCPLTGRAAQLSWQPIRDARKRQLGLSDAQLMGSHGERYPVSRTQLFHQGGDVILDGGG